MAHQATTVRDEVTAGNGILEFMDATIFWRGEFLNDEVNVLHAEAFGTRVFTSSEWDWKALVQSHSLGWVTARETPAAGDEQGSLLGFVNVVWDGSSHAWLQDVMVSAATRRLGIGRGLVATARKNVREAGCEWLHVDFDDELRPFYVDACGFTPAQAGTMRLVSSREDAPRQ